MLREGIVAVVPGLRRSPPGVRDYWDASLDSAMLDSSHFVELMAFDGFRKVGVRAEVNTCDAIEMNSHFKEERPLSSDTLALSIEFLVVYTAVNKGVDVVVVVACGNIPLVAAFCVVP